MRAVVGRPAAISFLVENEQGEAVDSETPVNVTVYNEDGDVLSTGVAVKESTGVYVHKMVPTVLDMLMARASATVGGLPMALEQSVRVVSGRVFRLADLRAAGVDAELVGPLEEEVAEKAERILGYAPVLVGRRVSFRCRDYRSRLVIPEVTRMAQVYSLLGPDGQEVPVEISGGLALLRTDGNPFVPGGYQLHASCGLGATPADLSQACLQWARSLDSTRGQAYDPRTVRVMTESSELYLARVGDDRPTGYPDVDYVLTQYRQNHAIGVDAHSIL